MFQFITRLQRRRTAPTRLPKQHVNRHEFSTLVAESYLRQR